MKHLLIPIALLGGLALLILPEAQAQQQTDDEVTYTDSKTKKETKNSGTIIEETPGQITLKRTTSTVTIPALDVIDVKYGMRPALAKPYGDAARQEGFAVVDETKRKTLLPGVIKAYKDLLLMPELKQYPKAQTHIEFKILRLLSRLAEDEPKKYDEQALEALEKFKKAHPNSWQLSHCARLLVAIQIRNSDWEGAAKTYDDLAQLPKLDRSVQREYEMMSAEVLMKARKYAEAKKRFEKIMKDLPPNSMEARRLKISLIQCSQGDNKNPEETEKELLVLIKGLDDKDPAQRELKAVAYNTLGDCLLARGKDKEAFWRFMFVEVEYNENRAERKKALEQLAQLFQKFGDAEKAKQYKEMAQKLN